MYSNSNLEELRKKIRQKQAEVQQRTEKSSNKMSGVSNDLRSKIQQKVQQVNQQRQYESLMKAINFDTFSSDLQSMGRTIQNTYGTWQTPEQLAKTKLSVQGMQNRIKAYQQYQSLYGGESIDDIAKGYDQVLNEWSKLEEMYGSFKDAKTFNTAKIYSQYSGSTYDQIQKALSEMDAGSEDYDILKNFVGYTDLAEFDKAIEGAKSKKSNGGGSTFGNVKNANETNQYINALEQAKTAYIKSMPKEEIRKIAEQNVAAKYGTLEEFVKKSTEADVKFGATGKDKQAESVYKSAIDKEVKRLSSGSKYYDLTNSAYRKKLDKLQQSATTPKEFKFLETETQNLEKMSEGNTTYNIHALVYKDQWEGTFFDTESGSNYDYEQAEKELREKYSDDEIESMKKTYARSFAAIMEEEDKDSILSRKPFYDGYDPWDISKSIFGTGLDAGVQVAKGYFTGLEGFSDFVSYGLSGIADLVGADEFAKNMKKTAQKDVVQEVFVPGEEVINEYSGLGDKAKAVPQAIGQIMNLQLPGQMAQMAGVGQKGVSALTSGHMFTGSMGSGMSEAYNAGATDGEAVTYGLISGAGETLSEMLFAGMGKSINAIGFSKGLSSADDMLAKKVSRMFSNQIAKNMAELGIKAGAEGVEEILAGVVSAAGKKLTFKSEEDFMKLLKDEKLLEQFVVGAVASGFVQSGYVPGMRAGSVREANAKGTDFITGQTQNEQKLIESLVAEEIESLEKKGEKITGKKKSEIRAEVTRMLEEGEIDVETIERTLGKDRYDEYTNLREEMDEYKKLNKIKQSDLTGEQADRLAELKEKNKTTPYAQEVKRLRRQLSEEVDTLTQNDSFIRESYNEKAKRSQRFVASATPFKSEAAQKTIKNAVDNLNNTKRSHKLVEALAKISEAKGIVFGFTDNAKLKKMGIGVRGKNVNGYIEGSNVTLNLNSTELINKVVGHEVTHFLEGTEHYEALRQAMEEYVNQKGEGEYAKRLAELQERYKNVKDAVAEKELLADLVGEYLFTDEKFVRNLSAKNRNLFQKIYDEIKYLVKTFAGSKEGKALEKVKKTFEEVYREDGKKNIESMQYAIGYTKENKPVAIIEDDIFNGKFSELGKAEKIKLAKNEIKKFRPGIPVSGRLIGVTKKTADHYTNSDYTDIIRKNQSAIYEDKLNASKKLDDVIYASTDYVNEELNHERKDDITQFARGNVLLDIGGNQYNAKVIVGYKENGEMVFYDLQDLTQDSFEYKRRHNQNQSEKTEAGKTIASPNSSIPQTQQNATQKKQFSLSSAIEQTKDLTAMHNITSEQLTDALKRDALLGSSVAVTNKSFTKFGDITLMFDKNTIDPLLDEHNKLYGADAWTPTQTKLKKNPVFDADKTSEVVSQLEGITKEEFKKRITTEDGSIYDAFAHDRRMQKAYAKEKGIQNIDSELDSDAGWRAYKQWLNNISDNVITSYDNAGNEDVLSNMRKQKDSAKPFKLSADGELVVPAVEYDSIDTVRQNKGRLSQDTEALTKEVANKFLSWANKVGDVNGVVDVINSAFEARYNVEDIANLFQENGYNISQKAAEELQNIYKQAVELPTEYFEAKPLREIGLDEIKAVVVPNTIDSQLRNALTGRGLRVVEYDPNVEGDRQRVVNSFEDLKFQLSDKKVDKKADIAPAPKGAWQVKGKDIAVEGIPMRRVAPAQETDIAEGIPMKKSATAQRGTLGSLRQYNTSEEQNINAGSATENKKISIKNTETIENLEASIANYRHIRDTMQINFDAKISAKEKEYNSLGRKDTKKAEQLLTQISNLKDRKRQSETTFNSKIRAAEERIKSIKEAAPFNRSEFHKGKIDFVKTKFSDKGYDFDEVLSKAKDKSTLSSVDNTPQRFIEKTLGYTEGQILNDLTVNKIAQDETRGIKWLNSFTDRKNGFIKQISKQYNIKPGSKEDAAAQMYGEGFYVDEAGDYVKYGDAQLAKDFPDPVIQRNIKGLAKDPRIRQTYDETLETINEPRRRNGYPEIPRRENYFLHFRAMDDFFSRNGIPFNPESIKLKDLPTDLYGMTMDLKPGQPYFSSSMQRKGVRTTYSLLGGMERYLTSAKNQIFHLDNIQMLRALRNYIADTFGQAKGLEDIDEMPKEQAEDHLKKVYGGHLGVFAKFLNDEANVLAGKTSVIDRAFGEGLMGRRIQAVMDTVNRQVGTNMVGYSASSALVNLDAIPRAFGKLKKKHFFKGLGGFVSNKVKSISGKGDDFAEKSTVQIRRKGADKFYRTPWQKIQDAGYALMGAVDNVATEIIARAKYAELIGEQNLSPEEAHYETDKWVSKLMGDRSLGQQPLLYTSKVLGIFTKFNLEVRNNLDSIFYDTIKEKQVTKEEVEQTLKKNAKTAAKITSTITQVAIANHLFGSLMEATVGYNPTMDLLSVLMTALGFDDEEDSEDEWNDNLAQAFDELLDDLPYISTFTEGGRIPMQSVLPYDNAIEAIKGTWTDATNGNWKNVGKEWMNPLLYLALPAGGNQIKKTYNGLSMFDDDLPISGSYTDSGKLRYDVPDTLLNRTQAALFGEYAHENAREYFDKGQSPLTDKQLKEMLELEKTAAEYREWRKRNKKK